MVKSKNVEMDKAEDVRNFKAICRTCDSELVIAYGTDYQGKQGFDVNCPQCGYSIFAQWPS